MQLLGFSSILALLVMSFSAQVHAYLTSGEPVLLHVMKHTKQAANQLLVKKTLMFGQENIENVTSINGFDAFQRTVVEGSSLRPVVVFFFAQRDALSQEIWQRLSPVLQDTQNKPNFVTVDVFQESEDEKGHKDNQNYQIAMKCIDAVGLRAVSFPVMVFFSKGLMCASERAVLCGDIQVETVRKIIAQLFMEKTSAIPAKNKISAEKNNY